MSGESNVAYWFSHRGIEVTLDTIKQVFAAAKAANRLLSSEEILALVPTPPERQTS